LREIAIERILAGVGGDGQMLILALIAAAAVAPADGKTMALDDWHAMTIYGVAGDGSGPTFLQVHAGDLDGDGVADDAVVRLTCAAGKLSAVHFLHEVKSPRDSASGQASGKRMHKPITITKEWGPATPMLNKVRPTYNVKSVEGARMASDGWTALTLANADGLCPAAETAARRATKTRSNIQNN
jgi:hypothetical protein